MHVHESLDRFSGFPEVRAAISADDAGEQCYNVLFEARPGKRFDRFDDLDDPDEVTRVAKEVFLEFAPWEQERMRVLGERRTLRFWQTRTILKPTKPYKETMLAATLVPEISPDFFESLNRASILWPWIDEKNAVKSYITRVSGRKWWKLAAAARARVIKAEIAKRLPGASRPAQEQTATL